MSSTVKVSIDWGKYKTGTVFEVVKCYSETTVCLNEKGKRVIIANKYLEDKETTGTSAGAPLILELNIDQHRYVYIPMLKAVGASKEGNLSISDFKVIGNSYRDKSGLSEKEAIIDVKFVYDKLKEGYTVIVAGAPPIGATAAVGADLAEAEARALAALVDGDMSKLSHPALSVTSDSMKEAIPEEPVPKLKENQIWFTDITGGRKPKSNINHIIEVYPSDHWPKDQHGYIPEVKDTHYWDTEVLECLVLAHKLREKALVTGLPGTGKSSSVEQFAAWLCQPYTRIGGRGDLESADLIGGTKVTAEVTSDGSGIASVTKFEAGILTQAIQSGHLTTIDEVMKIPSYIQMCMQHLYEKDGYLLVNDIDGTAEDKKVRPPPSYLMILTDNVKGTGDDFAKFGSTQVQDTSTLDRINLNETLNYLDPKIEVMMLHNMFPTSDEAIVVKLVKFAGLVRNGYKAGQIALTLSPRGLIAILEYLGQAIPVIRAIELAFINKIADESESNSIRDMLKTVGLSKI